MAKIRVLHILASLERGGVETWLLNVLRHIDRQRFEFTFGLTTENEGAYGPLARQLGAGFTHCPLKRPGFSKNFGQLLQQERFDIVHSHIYLASGLVLKAAKIANVPVRIAHGHTTYDGHQPNIQRWLYRKLMRRYIDKFATLGLGGSKAIMPGLFGKNWEKKNNRKVLYYGTDLDAFDRELNRDQIRKKFSIPLNARVVGHIGGFRPPKNHTFLIEVAEQVFKMTDDVYFVLRGDGSLKSSIEEKIRKLGIGSRIIMAPPVEAIADLMVGAMDVFILPSTREGLPLVLIEAQAAGLRILASKAITPEISILDNAVRFEPLEAGPEKWANAILELLDKEPLNRKDCLEKVKSSPFSIDNSSDALMKIYSASLQQRQVG
jgi:glycosyltransferase involved in cell wall biosynthesis